MDNGTKKMFMVGALLLGCGLTSLLAGVIGHNGGSWQQLGQGEQQRILAVSEGKQHKQETMRVYISGAVLRPGLYDVPSGARADDAIVLAGGMALEADTEKINLALKLKDGMHVNVPYKKAGKLSSGKKEKAMNAVNNKAKSKVKQSSQENVSKIININKATAKELATLPGIGPSTAQRIMAYRNGHPFTAVEELTKVSGIGKAKLERIRGRVTV